MSTDLQLPWDKNPPLPDVLLGFFKHDDRPTIIFNTESKAIIFRNPAFESHVHDTGCGSSLSSWIQSSSSHVRQSASETTSLGAFAREEWLANSLGQSLVAVFCQRKPRATKQEPREVITTSTGGEQDNRTEQQHEPKLKDMRMKWLEPISDPWMSFLRQYPFEQTALGPMSAWDRTLCQVVQTIMTCPEPRILYWGTSLCMIYNEAALPVIAKKHPCLGSPLATEWGQAVHDQIVQTIMAVMHQGKGIQARDVQFILERDGFPEETWHNFHQLPITSQDGHFLGCLCEFTENTVAYTQKNRSTIVESCLQTASRAINLSQLWSDFFKNFESNSLDIVSGLVYTVSTSQIKPEAARHSQTYTLAASFAFEGAVLGEAPQSSMTETFNSMPELEDFLVLTRGDNTLPSDFSWETVDRGPVTTACVVPIADLNKKRLAFVVLGMNPRRPFDETSRAFVLYLADLLHKSAVFITIPEQERKNEKITSALSHKLEVALLKAEKSEATFARMARDAPIGMFTLRPDGYPLFVNDSYLELIGTSRATFFKNAEAGLDWTASVYEEDREFVESVWQATLAGDKPVQAELRVKAPTESSPSRVRWLESTSYGERDESGTVNSVQGWLVEITPRKLAERLMSERLNDALETKRTTETFLDMVSHEMRNPLSSILQTSDSILGILDGPEVTSTTLSKEIIDSLKDAAETIALCGKHQRQIIDEILTFSRLDSNLLVLSLERAQITKIVQTAIKMFKLELHHAEIEASLHVEKSYQDLLVDYVLVDPGRLLQVIINLLTNAIKFTRTSEKRRITINLGAVVNKPTEKDCGISFIPPRNTSRDSSFPPTPSTPSLKEWTAGEDVFIYLGVQDTGRGLTEDETKVLFQRFAQASPKTYKTYGGSGLGLFISRGLTELQGGQIGVKSKFGEGSTFAFYIKAQKVGAPQEASRKNSVVSIEASTEVISLPHEAGKPDVKVLTRSNTSEVSSVSPKDLHILVVEDNSINQKVIAQQLRRLGVNTVHLADNGLEALKFLSSTTFVQSVDTKKVPLSLILLDVEMPVMDGLSCVRRIRQLEANGEILGHVPVIAVTANARGEQIAVALEAGMDEVVTKPFRIPELIPRMEALVQRFASPD